MEPGMALPGTSRRSSGRWTCSKGDAVADIETLQEPLLLGKVRKFGRRALNYSTQRFVGLHVAISLLALASTAHMTFVAVPTPGIAGTAPAGVAFVMPSGQVKQIGTPVGALLLGFIFHQIEQLRVAGKLLIYFGAQTGMNLYMKAVLSKTVVSEELGLVGVPAAFLVTALQQIVAFILFISIVALSWFTPYRYTPKALTTKKDIFAVCCFSLSFAINIGLNNFSLSLLPISLNLIIRSCLPLSTAVSQNILGRCTNQKSGDVKPKEFAVMIIGVLFVALATVAKSKGTQGSAKETSELILGVFVGCLSILSGAINFVLAGWLGTQLKLNPLDTTCYMSLPATVFLCFPIFLMPHPVSWPGFGSMTDWQVFTKLLELSPSTVGLALLSGVFAISYNVLQYALVQSLSAAYTAFAGNMNKAATVALALLFGIEQLPEGTYGVLMFIGIFGNITAFTTYSLMKQGKGSGH